MIKGIGIDIIELSRIEKLMERQPSFINRILADEERTQFHTLKGKRKLEFLAGRFAAKEAFSKAYGTGIGKHLSFHDIVIANEPTGKPYIQKPVGENIHLSISHSEQYAVAQVIIESLSS
ncbi:holo-ACP synthase [Sutcliffiella cohnii]|uniref:Holo-[acyl-carrier-protein] synthase n=1 Tax=Sutcliffiella cohnii TaxID=33932 RepID=A0A223KXE4_9BACI|nr:MULTISPECIES: holo-ACP synthase [Sutcliffiella]AST94126.1 holo-ACP synthase [Sutcliffiella cohnii]MED4017341.1 holo-ACP synthase [Sutcliffiella cohnii]WBL15339.1 holo-ACP synthase [Sutcliffiella sp. NC1]